MLSLPLDLKATACLYVYDTLPHYGFENSKRLRARTVSRIGDFYGIIQHRPRKILDFVSAARHEVEWWRGYEMEPADHCFDGDFFELFRHCSHHVENAVVGTASENYQLAVFLDRHDDLVGEIIESEGTVSFQKDVFVSSGFRMDAGYVGKDKDVREYLSRLGDSLESVGVVRHERFVEADVFLHEPEYLAEAIPVGRLPQMYLRTGV